MSPDPARPIQPKGEAWAVLRMHSSRTLPFFDLLQELDWLEGWTPIRIEGEERRPMLPGTCFLPAALWEWAVEDAHACGIPDVRPAKFNGNMMLTDWEALEGLRQAEKQPFAPLSMPLTFRIGMQVRISDGWFEGNSGLIKRLDADYAHLDVPGLAGRLVVSRDLLQPI